MDVQPVPERWSVVVAGAWNRAVFGPKWVSATLASGRPVTLEVPLDNVSLGYRIVVDNISLRVDGTRLELKPIEPTDAALEAVQSLADNILETLSHTPVSAIGVNFAYQETPISAQHLDLFTLIEKDAISDLGYEILDQVIRSSIRRPDDQTVLNLTAKFTPAEDKFSVDFNFHRQVLSAKECREVLGQGLTELKGRAIQVLSSVYKSEVE